MDCFLFRGRGIRPLPQLQAPRELPNLDFTAAGAAAHFTCFGILLSESHSRFTLHNKWAFYLLRIALIRAVYLGYFFL